MAGSVAVGGGFNGSIRDRMSPTLQRRLAAEEAAEAREIAQAERDREAVADELHSRNLVSAIVLAEDAGEWVDVAGAMRDPSVVGHTHQEFLQMRSDLMDLEDFQAQAEDARSFRRWQTQRSDGLSADVTPMSPEEKAADAELLSRGRAVQARRRELRQVTTEAVNTVYDRWISPRGVR